MGAIKRITSWIKEWILIVSILAGIGGYFLYVNIPSLDFTHSFMMRFVEALQPCLIFAMLFVTFCKVDVKHLHVRKWHLWLLLFQCGMFLILGLIVMLLPEHSNIDIVLEGAMICFICPVATAGAVVTQKFGGSASAITTYTILINLFASILIPIVVPYLHPETSMSTFTASMLILGKVFPLLLLPLVLAILVRQLFPKLHKAICRKQEFSFYLWVVALFLAIAVTTHFIMHTNVSLSIEIWLVVVTGISCAIQFSLGWKIGSFYNDRITAGQALGQKNTVLAIWVGYTFFNPITALAGGFYSIFHNVVNSWQLHRMSQKNHLPSPELKNTQLSPSK